MCVWVCACVHVNVHTLVWAHTCEARGWLSSSIKKTRLSLNLDLTSQLWDPGDVPASALIELGLQVHATTSNLTGDLGIWTQVSYLYGRHFTDWDVPSTLFNVIFYVLTNILLNFYTKEYWFILGGTKEIFCCCCWRKAKGENSEMDRHSNLA